jgi:aryl sulfotransferase
MLRYEYRAAIQCPIVPIPMPQPVNGVVWIASYPKSGNTWVRFLACNLLFGRQESAQSLSALVPDIHEMGAAAQVPDDSRVYKTHYPFSAKLPSAVATVGAVYVVRDPADVLISNFFYSQRSAEHLDDSTASFNSYIENFIQHRGDRRWIELGMGTWHENVRSWFDASLPFPVVKIRYEDMVSDPEGACWRIADLVKPGCTAADISEAVRNSSFQRMRDIERADIRAKRVGIFYKPYLQSSIDSGHRFMRRGVPGDGRARLTPEQRARLYAQFGALLPELGYSIA